MSESRALLRMTVACLVWALVSWLSSANLDGYHDMLESHAWSHPLRLGTHKHPPFFSWTVGLWFAIWPKTDWAYRLLSYTNVLVGLLGVWTLGRRLGPMFEKIRYDNVSSGRNDKDFAAWGALLLLWAFPYTTLAGKFNANSQLLSLWPWVAALLLASWQERGWRGALFSVGLGLVAAASVLSKYFSGVFLIALLPPALLHENGRRWLATSRPYLALTVFVLTLLPHLLWIQAHDWPTLRYGLDQGGGEVSWGHVFRFLMVPFLYWLPAWMALNMVAARMTSSSGEGAYWARLGGLLVKSWVWQGPSDVLWWLAFAPWALTLGFGLAGVAELSTPWAIPIGYAFSLLWLRNLERILGKVALGATLERLGKAWWPVLGAVLMLGSVASAIDAYADSERYYRPTREAASAIEEAWQERHPGQELKWVGGDWPEIGLLGFYTQRTLHTVPDLPDGELASMYGLHDWQQKNGVLLCPMGAQSTAAQPNECIEQARIWLQDQGLPDEGVQLWIQRDGWRFPHPIQFGYMVFDVDSQQQETR